MSLPELRQISDLDLTDKDLAEVIQAIHADGAVSLHETSDAVEHTTQAAQHTAPPCLICQQTMEVSCKDCVLCHHQDQEGLKAHSPDLQAVANWLQWQRQFLDWMMHHHPDTVRNNSQAV